MRRTILLADDSVTIRKIVELTFSDTDIRVVGVASGQEALDRWPDLRPDIVLADVVMPGPSGYELCRTIKASSRPVPVLLLAGTFEPFDAEQARTCGSDGHLTKPFDSRQLVMRVEELLARGAQPAAPAKHAPQPPAEELESMFDELATPARPWSGDHDARPAPAGTAPLDAVTTAAAPAATVGTGSPALHTLSPADLDALARLVVERLSDRVLREIAWDVVPDMAEMIVRERIRDLERDEHKRS